MHEITTTLIYKATLNDQTSIENVYWFWFLEPEKKAMDWCGMDFTANNRYC